MRIDRASTPKLQVALPTVTSPPAQPVAEPSESFGTRLKHGVGAALIEGGNDWKLAAGGALGITTGTLFLYTGLVGGALLGTMVGGGLAPMVASLGSHGVSSFLGTALATTKGAAFIGMAAGATTGALGGWKAGNAIASVPGNVVRWAGKKMLGSDPEGSGDKNGTMLKLSSTPMQILGSALIGVAGAVPGALGGIIVGGGAAAGGSLVAGLAAHNLTLASILSTGSTGALIGGTIGLAAGSIGGYALLQGVRRGGGKILDGEQQASLYLHLESKEKRLAEIAPQLQILGQDLANNNGNALQEHNQRVGPLEIHEKEVAAAQAKVETKETTHDKLSDQRAQQLYDQTKGALQTRDDGEVARQTQLDSEDKRVDGKVAAKEKLVDQAQNQLYNDREHLLENQFQSRKSAGEQRDAALHQAEKDIPQTVAHKVEQTLTPLRADLSQHKANTKNYDSQTASLKDKTATDLATLPGLKSATAIEQQTAASLHDKARGLKTEQQSVSQDVTSLHSQNEAKKVELDRREQGIYDRLQSNLSTREGQLNDFAQQIRNQSEESYRSALAPRESDMRSQIDSARNQETQARGRRDAVVAAASAAAAKIGVVQNKLDQANNDLSASQSRIDSMENAVSNLKQQLAEEQADKGMLDQKQSEIQAREKAAGKPNRSEAVAETVRYEAPTPSSYQPSDNGYSASVSNFSAQVYPEVPRRQVDSRPFDEPRAYHSDQDSTRLTPLSHDLHDRLEAQYQDRKGKLDGRERDLQRQQSDIPNQVAQRVEQALNPLRDELRQVQSNASGYDDEASRLQSQTSSDLAAISGLESQVRTQEQAAQQAHSRLNGLEPQLGQLNTQVTNLRAQNEARKTDLDRREQALAAEGK